MSFTAINLDRLTAPEIIEQLDFETIFAARKARLIELAPDLAPVLELQSEPLVQFLQEGSYRELMLRKAVQDAARGNMLAYATGEALDHLAAFYGVARQIVQAGDPNAIPPTAAVMEDDTRLRARAQLAPEGMTTAGTIGSYKFWALSASSEVRDVAVLETANPGEVRLVVLSTKGDGTASAGLLAMVDTVTTAHRPLTDLVMVEAATILSFEVTAELTILHGPDGELVRQAAETAVQSYVSDQQVLGRDITIAGLHAALFQEGVQDVTLLAPSQSLRVSADEAAYCTAVSVSIGGYDD